MKLFELVLQSTLILTTGFQKYMQLNKERNKFGIVQTSNGSIQENVGPQCGKNTNNSKMYCKYENVFHHLSLAILRPLFKRTLPSSPPQRHLI